MTELIKHRTDLSNQTPEQREARERMALFPARAASSEPAAAAAEKGGKLKAAYTYDAGPNAVIYAPKENIKEIVELIVKYFPQAETFKDPFGLFGAAGVQGKVVEGFNEAVTKPFHVGAVKGFIHTRVGDGPRTLGEEESLLGPDGLPK